jgi:hypothetical protein
VCTCQEEKEEEEEEEEEEAGSNAREAVQSLRAP